MAKLRHINLHNLVHLTGLNDQRAVQLAKVLDELIADLMVLDDVQGENFRVWRRRATFSNIQPIDYNFSIRAYQTVNSELKLTTIYSIDGSETDGSYGTPRRGAFVYCYMGDEDGQQIVSVPLVYILREHGPVHEYQLLYEHGAVDYSVTAQDVFRNLRSRLGPVVPMPAAAHGSNCMVYVGITSRPWTVRYREHLNSAARGSNLPFHRALRETFGTYNTRFHYVLKLFRTREEVEDAEEQFVDERSLYPKGLNAIPGGKAGLRYLAALNALKPREQLRSEDREERLVSFLEEHPEVKSRDPMLRRMLEGNIGSQETKDRPEMAAFWSSDENAARMITSRSDRLTVSQIRNARYAAATGLSAQEICKHVGALNVDVINRLLSGKTYARVT